MLRKQATTFQANGICDARGSNDGDEEEENEMAMSYKKLAKAKALDDWEEVVPKKLIKKCRKIIEKSVKAVEKLGASPKSSKVLKIIQRGVESLNELEDEDSFIETDEREDLCDIFNQLANMAGIDEDSVADRWRDW